MNEQAQRKLDRLKRRYFLLRLIEVLLLSVGIGFLIYAALGFVITKEPFLRTLLSILIGLTFSLIRFVHYKLHRLSNYSFTKFLNQNFPQLKESADLMLFDEDELNSLQQLQQAKTIEQFNLIYPYIKLPHHIIRSLVILAGCLFVYILSSSFLKSEKIINDAISSKQIPSQNGDTSIFIRSVSISIFPPAYTNVKSSETKNFDLSFPEGSDLKWQLEFSGQPNDALLLFSNQDSLKLESTKNYIIQKKFFESGFYQIQWRDKNKTHRSDYYKLEVTKDQLPKVELKNQQQFTKLKYTELSPLTVSSVLSDDYGVADAILVATVSKGSGESVKFREEKLRFTSPQKISGKNLVASRSLDLKKLGLEPGDELYFYAEVWDNKTPTPNHARTETFFIAVQDTATEITSADSGLGVDLMPEYFRSQRQIIIDTEKLLRDKKRITKQEFNSTSNELGYDQKVLRLRYGQFLGEEEDAGIGQEAVAQQEEEQDVTKQFGHAHDTKNEHNLVDQKKDIHKHEGEVKNPEEKEDPVKAFAHSHDNTEEATFFEQSLKAKLKAAVTIMWDAELYLRLYEPEKSLPYQYKALNLLKEISNDSRIYVHRTGFDPPPLKEDKRLTADLSEIKTNTNLNRINSEKDHPAIRRALTIVEKLLAENTRSLSSENKMILHKAGQELSIEAIEQPSIYLKSLSVLKSLTDGQVVAAELHPALSQIQKSFWRVLPNQSPSPNKQGIKGTKLDREFLRSVEQIRND